MRRPVLRRPVVGPALCALVTLAGACERGEPSAGRETPPADRPVEPGDTTPGAVPTARSSIEILLVEEVPWRTEMAEGVDWRVAVRHEGRIDTLPGIVVDAPPIVVGDSAVWGFNRDQGDIVEGFRWRSRTREVETIELPDDFTPFLASGLSPHAAELAYVSRRPDGRLEAVVRSWPGKRLLYRSPPVEGYPSDAMNSAVEWTGDDRVEIRIRLDDLDPPGTWLRVRGSPGGAMIVDTMAGGGSG